MVFWYRNSVLASIVSIIGCLIVITGFNEIRSKEISVGMGLLMIAAGVAIAFAGYLISARKGNKKQGQARVEQNRNYKDNTTSGTRNTGNTTSRTHETGGTAGSAGQEYRFCPNCGAPLVPGGVFCGNCGAQVKAPSAGSTAGNTQQAEKPKESVEQILIRANDYAEKEDYQKELEVLLTGLSVDDKNATLLNNIGRAYRRLGHYDTALDYYFRSAAIDPDQPSIGMNIATVYIYKGEYDHAEKCFEEEIRKLETDSRAEAKGVLRIAYANYALCAGKKGDLNKARGLLNKAKQAGYEKCELIWKQLM